MKNPTAPSKGTMITASAFTALAICLVPAGGAFAADFSAPAVAVAATAETPSGVLASTAWETTGAVNQDGSPVALDDAAVANFVGWAYYDADGTFTMYNLDDTPKMQGDWSVSPDGSERTLVAKDAAGAVLFTRVVPITELTSDVFTYRIVPDAANPGVYYDIIHTPTDHAEPGATAPAPGEGVTEEAQGEELAATGGDTPVAAIVAGVVALLGGAGVLLTRFMRGRTSN